MDEVLVETLGVVDGTAHVVEILGVVEGVVEGAAGVLEGGDAERFLTEAHWGG